MLRAFFIALLAALAAAANTCAVFPNTPSEGCALAPIGCTCPATLFECNQAGGSCVGPLCTGTCRFSPLGYAVVIGGPLLLVLLLVLICCCCCSCCRRGGGNSREREVIIVQSPAYSPPSYGGAGGADDWSRRGGR